MNTLRNESFNIYIYLQTHKHLDNLVAQRQVTCFLKPISTDKIVVSPVTGCRFPVLILETVNSVLETSFVGPVALFETFVFQSATFPSSLGL
jgi:hypothetical protein